MIILLVLSFLGFFFFLLWCAYDIGYDRGYDAHTRSTDYWQRKYHQ